MIKNMVNRIMAKSGFKWRVEHGKTTKSFMERLATLNATKVRRSIIPKLRSNIPMVEVVLIYARNAKVAIVKTCIVSVAIW